MKKSFVFFLLVFLFVSFVSAQDNNVGGIKQGLEDNLEKAGDIKGQIDNLDEDTIAKDYLRQEWGKILKENKYFGPIISLYEKISHYTDPIFKYTVGVAPSLSLLFVLTLVIWITLFIYFYRAFKIFGFFSGEVNFFIVLAMMLISSAFQVSNRLAELVTGFLGLLTNEWFQIIAGILVIIGLIVLSKFSKEFEKWANKVKENREKMKEEIRKAEDKIHSKKIKEFSKAIDEGFKDK